MIAFEKVVFSTTPHPLLYNGKKVKVPLTQKVGEPFWLMIVFNCDTCRIQEDLKIHCVLISKFVISYIENIIYQYDDKPIKPLLLNGASDEKSET